MKSIHHLEGKNYFAIEKDIIEYIRKILRLTFSFVPFSNFFIRKNFSMFNHLRDKCEIQILQKKIFAILGRSLNVKVK